MFGKNEYYKSYDLKYKNNPELFSNEITPFIEKYIRNKDDVILDLGCGEGRDAINLLNKGYNVYACDVSKEAIKICNDKTDNKYKNRFFKLDLIKDKLKYKYDFIYSVSVLDIFLTNKHRDRFYNFIYNHLKDNGYALITVSGDGKSNESNESTGKIVNWKEIRKELKKNNLEMIKGYISHKVPGIDNSMCLIIKKTGDEVFISEKEAYKELNKGINKAEKILNDEDKMEDFLQRLEHKLQVVPVVGDILSYIPVLISLVKSYAKKEYRKIPLGSILAIISALLYWLLPVDVILDAIPGIGYIDDAAVVAACINLVENDVEEYDKWRKENNKKREE